MDPAILGHPKIPSRIPCHAGIHGMNFEQDPKKKTKKNSITDRIHGTIVYLLTNLHNNSDQMCR